MSAPDIAWRELHLPSLLKTETVLTLLRRLAADRTLGPVLMEARGSAGQVRHFIGTTAPRLRDLQLLIETLLPGASLQASDRAALGDKPLRLGLSHPALPLSTRHLVDTARTVLAALAMAESGETLALQIFLKGGRPARLSPGRSADPTQSLGSRLLTGSRPANAELARSLRSRADEAGCSLVLRLGSDAPAARRRDALLRGLIAALRTVQPAGGRMEFVADRSSLETLPRWGAIDLSATEVLNVMAWPLEIEEAPGMPGPHPKQMSLRASDIERDRVFGTTTAPGETRPVGIGIEDALLHTHLIGPTGAGKSSTLLHLLASDFEAGRSVVIIDPKSDLIRDALGLVPANRVEDVVVLDPTHEAPVGMNPLHQPGRSAELVADSILGVFRDMYPSLFGPRTTDVLHSAILTLAVDENATLTWLPRLLTEASFRGAMVAQLRDSTLLSFWAHFDAMSPAQQAQFVGPVLSRLRQFLLRPTLRRVIDQARPEFALSDLFTKPRLLFVPLNTGLLGGEAARLLGSLLVSNLWGLSLARAVRPMSERTPVSIYIDEAHEFLRLGGDDLADALARSRSLGIAWHLAHQYRDQLPPEIRAAIDANARNKIVFTLGVKDARDMAAMAPGLSPEDFVALPRFHVYTSLMRRGERLPWVSARTLAPPQPITDADELVRSSARRYGHASAAEEPAPQNSEPSEAPSIGRKRRHS